MKRTRRSITTCSPSCCVGGGPTGVEMAGALAELRRYTLKSDFRRINPQQARIILAEASPRLLATFPAALARKAQARLERVGVEVRTGQAVKAIDEAHVVIGTNAFLAAPSSGLPRHAFAGGHMAQRANRQGWTRARAAGLQCAGPSGGLRHRRTRRHSIRMANRCRRRASGHAAGALRGQSDYQARDRACRATTVPLCRQRQHGP